MLSDDELLNFDRSRLADPADERQLLATHGDTYRAQLVAARWIDGWRERMADGQGLVRPDEQYSAGVDYALREVVAHLRQGDFVPGGPLYDEEIRG